MHKKKVARREAIKSKMHNIKGAIREVRIKNKGKIQAKT